LATLRRCSSAPAAAEAGRTLISPIVSPLTSIVGWFGARSPPRVNLGAAFRKGSSRYFCQSVSGSIVCRSLSMMRNPRLAMSNLLWLDVS
jgi:hypothetical protein